MDPILIFLVLPIAIIILAIVLQRILKCPILVALTFFAIFLILTFTVFGTDFLIFAILYTILAFIAAFLADLFCRIARRLRNWDDNNFTITSSCGNGDSTELLAINSNGNYNNNGRNNNCNANNWSSNSWNNNWSNNNCNCGNNSNNSESIVVSAEVVPNSSGGSGCFRGNFRRRCRF